MSTRRSWTVIKLGEDDYAALGVLIQGPRCEDEKLVALAEIEEALGQEIVNNRDGDFQTALDFIVTEFGGLG